MSNLNEKVTTFVANFHGDDPKTITLQTSISDDLRIDGDDGDELMIAFFEQFNVNPKGYSFHNYFATEGFNPFSIFPNLYKIIFKKSKGIIGTRPLTIQMLIDSAKTKKWVDPFDPFS